jgi:hypothetical protein
LISVQGVHVIVFRIADGTRGVCQLQDAQRVRLLGVSRREFRPRASGAPSAAIFGNDQAIGGSVARPPRYLR